MTKAFKSSLVLDGSEIKLRLEAERQESGSAVHVDWLRFTVLLRNASGLGDIDALWAAPLDAWQLAAYLDSPEHRMAKLLSELRQLPDGDFSAGAQAAEFCREVCETLGPEFLAGVVPAKGHDFYKYRLQILRAGVEVGWVGYLASGDSPRACGQNSTMHCNLYGSACTFAASGWRDRMAALIDARAGVVTRCDLALDFFDGLPRGMAGVVQDYESGLCDVRGARPKYSQLGRWSSNPGERSFYLGSKQAGKQTNIYEKGHQLFGSESGNPWVRVEIRYGNKLRVLPSDMLRRPADFFGGASDWHQSKLAECQEMVIPQSLPQAARLAIQTVDAEVSRLIRWAKNTAGPTIAALWKFAPTDLFCDFEHAARRPGRISKFLDVEIQAAFARLGTFSTAGGVSPVPG